MFWRRTPRPPLVREMRLDDSGAVAVLHAESFARGWSGDEIERLLMDHAAIGHLALDPRDVAAVGFALSRRAGDEAELLSIAVARSHRGRRVGAALLRANLSALTACGVRQVFLEVESGNAPAIALYRRFGFGAVGQRPAYYAGSDGSRLNALVMRRDMD